MQDPQSFCLIYPLWSEGACTFAGNLMVQRNGVGVVAEKYLPHYCLRGERERASAAIPSYLCIRNVKNAKSPYPTLVAPTFGYLLRASTKSQKIVGLICRLKDHCSLSKYVHVAFRYSISHVPPHASTDSHIVSPSPSLPLQHRRCSRLFSRRRCVASLPAPPALSSFLFGAMLI